MFFVFLLGSYPVVVLLARRRPYVVAPPPLVPSGTAVCAPRAARRTVLHDGKAAALAMPSVSLAEFTLPYLPLRPSCIVPHGERTLLAPNLGRCTALMLGARTGAAEILRIVRAATGRLPAHRRIGPLQLHFTGGGWRRMRRKVRRSLRYARTLGRRTRSTMPFTRRMSLSSLAVCVGVAELALVTFFATTSTGCPEEQDGACRFLGEVGVTVLLFVATSAVTSTASAASAAAEEGEEGPRKVGVAELGVAAVFATTPTLRRGPSERAAVGVAERFSAPGFAATSTAADEGRGSAFLLRHVIRGTPTYQKGREVGKRIGGGRTR